MLKSMAPSSRKRKVSPTLGRRLRALEDAQPEPAQSSSVTDKPVVSPSAAAAALRSSGDVLRFARVARRPSRGLANLGNSCFANAALQLLLCSSYARRCFRNRSDAWGVLGDAVVRILSEWESGMSTDASKLLSRLSTISPSLTAFAQEDMHEFYSCLVDKMDDENAARIRQTFFGTSQTSTTCRECGGSSRMRESFSCLSLPCVDDAGISLESLRACMDAFSAPTELTDYSCEDCGKAVSATSRITVAEYPPTVVFHIKRFTMDGAKASHHVGIPQTLRLGGDRYVCVGVGEHVGYASGYGHYAAHVKDSADWVYVSDDTQRRSPEFPSRSQAYMCVYERVRHVIEERSPILQTLARATRLRAERRLA